MPVRPFDPITQRPRFKAPLERLFKSRFGTWMAINVGQHVDPYLMRATRGRVRLGITAPTILLTHTGRKTGKARTTPLLYFTEGNNIVLIASKGGAPAHPDWYHNLKANPDARATTHGPPASFVAREAGGEERERLWSKANTLYGGYDKYQVRAGDRQIPVMVLEPS